MKLYDSIEPDIQEWIMKQQVFFSASAPLRGKHINCSPKGLPSSSFSVINPNLCAYVDATGSGIESVANILENGRVTIMFCSFEASPRILRLFCTGRVLEFNEPGFDGWLRRMGDMKVTAARAIIFLDVFKVQTSCGYGVPLLTLKEDSLNTDSKVPYLEDRQTLGHWAGKKVASDTMNDYRAKNNDRSMDGLPGLKTARRDNGERLWYGNLKAHIRRQGGTVYTVIVAFLSAILTVLSMYMFGITNLPAIGRG